MSLWQQDFAVFSLHPELKYFDSAATCLMPKVVADAMHYYQCFEHANSHKGLYPLSANATKTVEKSREKVADFIGASIGASNAQEIIFTASTTQAINQVAQGYVKQQINALAIKDRVANVIVSEAEHHANLLPWQILSQETGVELRIAPITLSGTVDLKALSLLLDKNSVLVAINHVSNVLGTVNPIAEICQLAHKKSVPVLVDGAQAVGHIKVEVEKLSCDFYVFSAHKMYGPTGIGILFAKQVYLEQMQPLIVGGGIVTKTSFTEHYLLPAPLRFEAGSHNVAAIVGLSTAIDYLTAIPLAKRQNYLQQLSSYLIKEMSHLSFIKPLLAFEQLTTASIFSFVVDGVHSHDVASCLADDNIAVRAGHHCAQPLHRKLTIATSIRVSLGLYNSHADIDKLIISLRKVQQLLTIT
ncbi:MAG: cysteine desulfurase [Colwellia sp.]|nr:cysteine desulfurase [Colwellia sp.]